MKTLRQICTATILSLTFAVSVLAGDVHCPGVASTGTGTTSVSTEIILTAVSLTYWFTGKRSQARSSGKGDSRHSERVEVCLACITDSCRSGEIFARCLNHCEGVCGADIKPPRIASHAQTCGAGGVVAGWGGQATPYFSTMPDNGYEHAARLTVDLVDHGETPNELSEAVLEKLIAMAAESRVNIWRRGAGLSVESLAALYRLHDTGSGYGHARTYGDYELRVSGHGNGDQSKWFLR